MLSRDLRSSSVEQSLPLVFLRRRVHVRAHVFIVFHGMCVTCGCLWPGGVRGEREREWEEKREGWSSEKKRVKRKRKRSVCSH